MKLLVINTVLLLLSVLWSIESLNAQPLLTKKGQLTEADIDQFAVKYSPVVHKSGATLYELEYVAKALIKTDQFKTSATTFLENLSVRQWTDSSGAFKFSAKFFGFSPDAENVKLQPPEQDDPLKVVPIGQLSDKDKLICKMLKGNITKFSTHENSQQLRMQANTALKLALLRSQFNDEQQKVFDRTYLNTDINNSDIELVQFLQNRLYLLVKQKPVSELYKDRMRKVNISFLFDVYIPYTVYLEAFRNYPFDPRQSEDEFTKKLFAIKANLQKHYNFTDDSIWDIFCHINDLGPNVETLNLATVPGFLAWWGREITAVDDKINNPSIALKWARIGADMSVGDYRQYQVIVNRTSAVDLNWLVNKFFKMPKNIRLANLHFPNKKGHVLTYEDTFRQWYNKLVIDGIIAE